MVEGGDMVDMSNTILNRKFRESFTEKTAFEQSSRAAKKRDLWISGKTTFLDKGTASAKARRQEHTWYVSENR